METYLEDVNEQYSIWIGYDTRYHDYLVEGFRKVDGGVKHLVNRYKQPRLELIHHDLEHHGFFSKRPFQLGQGCDGSGDACCHALFYRFAKAENWMPQSFTAKLTLRRTAANIMSRTMRSS
jgi:hypothetical protein